MRHTLAMTLAYNGAPFSGFARQEGQLTVQGELEQALSLLYRREVPTTCAGRTDAGVHALGQVVSFDLTDEELESRPLPTLQRSLNAITHESIVIKAIDERPFGFSARFNAKAREYHYHLSTGTVPPLFTAPYAWHVRGSLDVGAMEEASRCLLGEHDFKSFCKTASAIDKPTCRNLLSIDFENETFFGESVLTMTIVGSSFLHSMVRTIMGTLVAVGRGLREPAWVEEVLHAESRDVAGETAPAHGLIFWRVLY